MKWIYTLLLEEDKYYVGFTENLSQRMEQHFTGEGAMWTKKYKPIKIIEIVQEINEWHEDFATMVMMRKYGFQNVRGGSWCSSYPLKREPKHLQNIDPEKSLEENLTIISNITSLTTEPIREIDYTPNVLSLFKEGRREYEISQITGLTEFQVESIIVSLIKLKEIKKFEIGLTVDRIKQIESVIDKLNPDNVSVFTVKSLCKSCVATYHIRYYFSLYR